MAQDVAPIITPNANDVLLGKGNTINSHPGNRQFRLLVDSQKQTFAETKQKKVKRAIAVQIVNEIEKLQPPGRFLVEDNSRNGSEKKFGHVDPDSNVHPILLEKIWIVVKPEKALSKIMHRLREKRVEESALISPDQQLGTELLAEDTSLDQVRLSNTNDGTSGMNHVRDTTKSSLENKDVDLHSRPTSSPRNLRHSHTSHLFDHTVATTNRNRMALEGNLDIDSCLSKYLEGYLDFESDATSAPQLDLIASHHLREYTLRQWVMSSKPQCSFNTSTSLQSSFEVNRKYVQSALLIALKLTECIIEAENDEHKGLKNPIPLASIAPENVLIRAKFEGVTENSDENEEVIEFAWFMSFVGDNSATGDVMARLFAMGKVLFELFSMGKLAMEDNYTTSIISLNHSDEAESDYRLQKKSHWRSTKSDDKVADWTASLDSNGVPWSLCALVKNLLDCRPGSFCDDDAYASFADLKEDLQLMVDNPSCFLDNIRLTNKPRLKFPDKLYGRDAELHRLVDLYNRHLTEKKINGVIISGRAGVGKTVLAMHIQKLTYQSNGYFLSAKFDQNQMSLKPFATISILFDSLCEKIFKDSSQSELKIIERDLTKAIGIQSTLLEVVPNLRKLMSSSVGLDSAFCSVEATFSMSYMLGELMRVFSSFSKPVALFIDDIQFADDASLQLLGNMIMSTEGASSFFIFCHREDEVSNGGSFDTWLSLVSSLSLEVIQLKSITLEDVNDFISETLHLSRRKTRSLSSVLHCKTSGNPLFLRQLLDSLTEQGLIYVDMNQHRWAWDLDKITNLKISNSVLALISKEIERLPNDLQLGLQVASCLGSCLAEPILSCLSKELGCDLKAILQQVCHKGVMLDINYSSMFCFAHDKIQEAVYEMMDDQQRRKYHMRFGLALFNHTLNDGAENEEVFFAAVNQINRGGPGSVREPSQMNIIAELNLKAGRRAIDLSDYNTAFELFQCGISYLGEDKWKLNYQLSLELFDAASGAAFVLNNVAAVKFYSDEVISYARCFDDKLNCLCNASKALATYRPEEAMETSFGILLQFGELLPRTMGDCELTSDIENMNLIIRSMSDDMICSLHENNNMRRCTLFNLYENMSHFLQFFKPWLFSSVSLRMVELTMKDGLSAKSPFAFANFGSVLISSGNVSDGYRLGKLALKMVDRRGSFQYRSSVISIVYDLIFWASKPLPSVIEALMQGHKDGQRSGDILIALKNMILSILNCYAAGQSLDTVQKNILDFISKIHGLEIFLASPVLLLSQITILRDGLNAVHIANLPTEREILSDVRLGPSISTAGKIYHLTRAFLFRQLDVLLQIGISEEVTKNSLQLNTDILLGYFFEGLASFQLARQSSFDESSKFVERGLSALEKVRGWSEHSVWNWESKMFLLEAENLYTEGIFFERAGFFYDRAIQSAHAHKFIHEEAIASELAGMFFHKRGFHEKSYSYFAHSIKSYEKWGAYALAKRVKSDVIRNFGCDIQQLVSFSDVSLDSLFTTSPGSSNKHRLD